MNGRYLVNASSFHIPLADNSVNMVATSTPYWGLRSYLPAGHPLKRYEIGAEKLHDCAGWVTGDNCGHCFVCHIRQVAAEIWRVLHSSGTFWLNLGDSMKDKELAGIPWLVALALKSDGWILRSEIVWEKPNALPESVTDRPTKVHEHIFLLAKSKRYFYDACAVREKSAVYGRQVNRQRASPKHHQRRGVGLGPPMRDTFDQIDRNRRSVWSVPTVSYPGAHFACWPPALVEPMIKAGSSEFGVCPACRSPWKRITRKGKPEQRPDNPNAVLPYTAASGLTNGTGATTLHMVREVETIGWEPTCKCPEHTPIPAVVLDPFAGSGTTVMVARQLGRVGIGLDLSFAYLSEQGKERTGLAAEERFTNGVVDKRDYSDLFTLNGAAEKI